MLRVQPLKLDMKARVSSTANTNASLVNHRCATSRRVGSRNPQHFAIDRCENSKSMAHGQKTAAETVWVLGHLIRYGLLSRSCETQTGAPRRIARPITKRCFYRPAPVRQGSDAFIERSSYPVGRNCDMGGRRLLLTALGRRACRRA